MTLYTVFQARTNDQLGIVRLEGDRLVLVENSYPDGQQMANLVELSDEKGAKFTMQTMTAYNFHEEEDEEEPEEPVADKVVADGTISKVDPDKRHVFGWAYVSHDKDGQVAVDKSGEFIDDYEEIEKAAYQFVVKSRSGDSDHNNQKASEMIESMVFTPEKIEKMGLPKGVLPTGWWVGFRVDDDALWASVKEGKHLAFSIHGKGTRKEVPE